jgi:DDE superfamily endonuclease
MSTPSPLIVQLLAPFAVALTRPALAKLHLLVTGGILAPRRRTVCAALAACGLGQSRRFGTFHRFFNRDRWSALHLSRLLLGLLVAGFLARDEPLIILLDETLERRQGRRIDYQSWFRDPVRSEGRRKVHCRGIRWLCACLLVRVPWSARPWALPFFVVPVLAEKVCQRLGKAPRSHVGWSQVLVTRLERWCPGRPILLVGDGNFMAIELVERCQQAQSPATLVTRMRLDQALYAFPEPKPPGRRGRPAKKGVRQPSPKQRLSDPHTGWQWVTLSWYGGGSRRVALATGVALWYTPKHDPVPIRWVLVRPLPREPQPFKPAALASSNPRLSAGEIVHRYLGRWNIEVTFAELRAHLGFETQRHWSTRAIGRVTPCLFGLFSLVVLLAKRLHPQQLPGREMSWYVKQEATFSDALAAVRRHLWSPESVQSAPEAELCLIPRVLLAGLQHVASYST